jgi:hypothetical protein
MSTTLGFHENKPVCARVGPTQWKTQSPRRRMKTASSITMEFKEDEKCSWRR